MHCRLCTESSIKSVCAVIGRISDCPKPHILDEDADVAEERQRIYKSEKTNDILCARDLSKVRLQHPYILKRISFIVLFSFFPWLDLHWNNNPCSRQSLYWSFTWRGKYI